MRISARCGWKIRSLIQHPPDASDRLLQIFFILCFHMADHRFVQCTGFSLHITERFSWISVRNILNLKTPTRFSKSSSSSSKDRPFI